MNNTKELIKILDSLVIKLKKKKEYLKNINSNFTRNRKLNFETVVNLLMSMESRALKDELYNYFGLNVNNPTSSALIQQRDKIKYEAFEWLYKEFNKETSQNKLYKGYKLLAIDGSDLLISFDKKDIDTYVNQGKNKGYNLLHINALYNLLENTYEDIIIQNAVNKDEHIAFNDFVDKYNGGNVIYIADRGYESYNSFAHVIESNQKFLIRVKDLTSSNGIISGLYLEEKDEFDIIVNRILTPKQTNEIKSKKKIYRFLSNKTTFDYINKNNPYYEIEFRIVRFKLDNGNYECIITNLSKEEFNVSEIKELYNMRWGIETSFREIKYSIGLNSLHSKRRDFIRQEIYIRILFFNLSSRIISKINPKYNVKRKHVYQINFTRAFHLIKQILIKIKSGIKPPDIESIIEKEIEPIRFGRSSPRNVRPQTLVSFVYR